MAPSSRGGEVDAGALLDGEAVHVRPQQDDRLVGRSVRCAAAQDGGDRRRALAEGDFVRQAVEGFENFLLGAGECQADLRLLVQLVAQPGDVALQFLGIGGDRHMFPLPERLVSA